MTTLYLPNPILETEALMAYLNNVASFKLWCIDNQFEIVGRTYQEDNEKLSMQLSPIYQWLLTISGLDFELIDNFLLVGNQVTILPQWVIWFYERMDSAFTDEGVELTGTECLQMLDGLMKDETTKPSK